MMAKTLNLCAIISAYSDLMIELRVIWQKKHLDGTLGAAQASLFKFKYIFFFHSVFHDNVKLQTKLGIQTITIALYSFHSDFQQLIIIKSTQLLNGVIIENC